MKTKLHSQSGASISYALLLFLVCAVIGSVVLAAGTAAAGRLSGLPEADQRYYSVTSAVELFRELYDGKTYTIQREKTYTETVTTVYTRTETDGVISVQSGTPSAPSTDPNSIGYSIKMDDNGIPDNPDLFQRFALQMLFGDPLSNYQTEDVWGKTYPGFSGEKSGTVTLRVEGKAALTVNVSYTLKDDRTVVLIFSNDTNDDPNADTFRIRMTLTAQPPTEKKTGPSSNGVITRTTTTGEPVTSTTTETVDGEEVVHTTVTVNITEKVTTPIKETKTSSITWRVSEVKVLDEGSGS